MFLLLIAASVKVKKKYQDPQYSYSVLLAKHLVLDVDLFKAMMWVCVQKCACLYRCVCISLFRANDRAPASLGLPVI